MGPPRTARVLLCRGVMPWTLPSVVSRSPLVVVFVVLGASAGLATLAWHLAGKPAEERVPDWIPRVDAPPWSPPNGTRDGDRILRGNLFARPPPPEDDPPHDDAPACDDFRLVATFVRHGAARESLALIDLDTATASRREGSRLSGWLVGSIDALGVSLGADHRSCQLSLFSQAAPGRASPAASPVR